MSTTKRRPAPSVSTGPISEQELQRREKAEAQLLDEFRKQAPGFFRSPEHAAKWARRVTLLAAEGEAAVRGKRQHAAAVAAAGGAATKLALTWAQVRPKWELNFRYYGFVGTADKATARDFACSWRKIQELRLAAGDGSRSR